MKPCDMAVVYAWDTLPETECAEFEAHLPHCTACEAELLTLSLDRPAPATSAEAPQDSAHLRQVQAAAFTELGGIAPRPHTRMPARLGVLAASLAAAWLLLIAAPAKTPAASVAPEMAWHWEPLDELAAAAPAADAAAAASLANGETASETPVILLDAWDFSLLKTTLELNALACAMNDSDF